jgi:SSS family solute:Na+ symporter
MKTLGKNLYEYLQSVQGYMSPAIVVLFFAGIFWKRATAPAAFWAFLVGAFGGFLRLVLDLLIDRPLKEHTATVEALQAKFGLLFSLQQIHWLYYAEGLFIVTAILLFVISMLTKAPPKEKEQYTSYGATPEQKVASRASWTGVPGDVKVPDTYRGYRTYGLDSNAASNAETDSAQAWPQT